MTSYQAVTARTQIRILPVSIPTGLGEMRNGIVVRASDALIAVGGSFGTLTETALALKLSRPLVGIRSWELPGNPFPQVLDAASAVNLIVEKLENQNKGDG